MLNSAILEVIVGMIFIFSLLSILVTQINSVIGSVFNLRTRHLRDGLDDLITDPVLRAKVFTHPLIRLSKSQMVLPDQKISDEQAEKITMGPLTKVSWIESKTFVQVMLNLLRVDADKELFGALLNVIDGMPAGAMRRRLRLVVNRLMTAGEGLDDLREMIANIEEPIYRDALMESLDQIDDEIGRLGVDPNSVLSVMAGLRKIKNPYFRNAMETILATSETLEHAEQQLETWFNDGMNRASAAFAQSMTALSLLVGILIALVLNVDSLQVGRTLWEDPVLRQTVNQAVQTTDVAALIEGAEADATAVSEGDTGTEAVVDRAEDAAATVNTLLELRLPIGWRYEDLRAAGTPVDSPQYNDSTNLWNFIPGNNPNWFGMIIGKILGLVTTMIAIAQGAPFWFNILNRIATGGDRGSTA